MIIPLADDQRAIAMLVADYAFALDDGDMDRLAACFTKDATADYGAWGGLNEGVEEIVATCSIGATALDATQHLLGPARIEVDGDSARSHCYLQALHVSGNSTFTVFGTYRDVLIRTPDGWRIRQRVLAETWTAGDPRVLTSVSHRS
jgi:3-phenylpropionate/cinnamic acid dioxygenase small subunit